LRGPEDFGRAGDRRCERGACAAVGVHSKECCAWRAAS